MKSAIIKLLGSCKKADREAAEKALLAHGEAAIETLLSTKLEEGLKTMWTIQLLGDLAARTLQREVTHFRTRKASALLAYLAFYKDKPPQAREVLADLFWPDADLETGRHNLSAELSPLRRLLEPPGVPPGAVLQADRFTVRLDPSRVTTDVYLFEQASHRALHDDFSASERLSLLVQAAEWYQGTLLPGYYEAWIEPEATRLSSLFLHVLVCTVPLLLETGAIEQALTYANRAVAEDPLSEQALKALLQTLMALNQPAQALRSYRAFARRLQDELDTQPSQTLQSLAGQLGQSSSPWSASIALESALHTKEAFVILASSPNIAERPERTAVSATASPTPRGRLVGGEFLLRTTTRFFDREAEVARLGKMLSTPRTRLVTLMGPGGTGKTRLALEATAQMVNAADWEDRPPITAVFVSLTDLSDAGRLFEVILRALGVSPSVGPDLLDQLAQALVSYPDILLILDNFEQLVEEGALRVHDLLAKAAAVKLLVTSRQKLRIEGEREFHLAPLPTSGEAQTPEALLTVSSIALFVDRAQTVLPDFQLTPRNAVIIGQLCDYLEGIPLAIELAAARVSVLTPAHILEQVQADRLDFLTARRRDAASRQRTLRATLDWSYHLLPEHGQQLLSALSVFHGGWTLEAAQAVCDLSGQETLELLADWGDGYRGRSALHPAGDDPGVLP